MKKIGGLLAVCITASLTLSGCGLYDIADLFSGLGKGSAQLYVNEELQMPVDGKDTILPGAGLTQTVIPSRPTAARSSSCQCQTATAEKQRNTYG